MSPTAVAAADLKAARSGAPAPTLRFLSPLARGSNTTNATGVVPLTKSGAPTTAQSFTPYPSASRFQRHRSICSVPTRLPLTLITSSDLP